MLSEDAKKLKREYKRKWREKNREHIRNYDKQYWERKAAEVKRLEEAEIKCE